ncbi:MAG: hypothetical protein Q8L88_02450 [Bacteroidota bacterium]|nr:hypothetical protein [Bacteroidota bacterium]
MSDSKKNDSGIKALVDLLFGIMQRQRKCRIEIDFDGSRYFWKVSISNMTADELPEVKE